MLTLRARGQTMPIWALGLATALVVALAAVQYGSILRWQIRAQNAADAAAAGALSVQAQAWNRQLSLVYAAMIEEWRIKNILEGLVYAGNNAPECGSQCAAEYATLYADYLAAVQRYSNDVQLVNRASQYTQQQAEADATAMVASLQQNCGQANGGDCAFAYSVTNVGERQGALNDVRMSGGVWIVNDGNAATPKDDYMPAQIEVVACANVTPVVPTLPWLNPPQFRAIGRAAATTAMVTQEWIQPGTIVNPTTNQAFQPAEHLYASGFTPSGSNDPFTVQYGGNPVTAYPSADAFSEPFAGDSISAVTGFWSTIPIPPYSGQLGSVACK